ncbi:MAG: hypothetical protein JXX28_06550 [Deltaproteobacteria bacterium]|nr:hypothetical protein [Deltaproteobacteria bacterium]
MRSQVVGVVALIAAMGCASAPEGEQVVEAPRSSAPPLAEPAPAELVERLADLYATSGDASHLLDASPIPWVPTGDVEGEGLFMRFEEPRGLDALDLSVLGGPLTITPYLDGAEGTAVEGRAGQTVRLTLMGRASAVFLKLGGTGHLGSVRASFSNGVARRLAAPIAVAGAVEASSTLSPADVYHASNLFDGQASTAWVEGSAGLGEGDTLTVRFAAPQTLTGIEVANGYQRSRDHFTKNARARTLILRAGGREETVSLDDTEARQRRTLSAPLQTQELTLALGQAWPGSRYQDLAITDLRFLGPDGPFTLLLDDKERLAQARRAQVAGTDLQGLVDRALVRVCGEGTLKLRSSGSFVAYSEDFDDLGDSYQEVLDGSWAPVAGGVQIYGRRHRIQDTFVPYQGTELTERTKVSGGKLSVSLLRDRSQAALAGQAGLSCLSPGERVEACGAGCVVLEGRTLAGVFRPARQDVPIY